MGTETVNDDHIRTAAYYIWLAEGQPKGMDEVHWHRARAELGTDRAQAEKPARKPRRIAKAPAAKSAPAAPKPRATGRRKGEA